MWRIPFKAVTKAIKLSGFIAVTIVQYPRTLLLPLVLCRWLDTNCVMQHHSVFCVWHRTTIWCVWQACISAELYSCTLMIQELYEYCHINSIQFMLVFRRSVPHCNASEFNVNYTLCIVYVNLFSTVENGRLGYSNCTVKFNRVK